MKFKKPLRKVNRVFIHCSASDNPNHDDISVIRQWHLDKKWSDVGYHYFITKNGELQIGRSLEKTPAAQKGHNTNSIAICLHGLDIKRFTDKQYDTLILLCNQINNSYNDITFHGHNEVDKNKTCPVFDYRTVLNLDEWGYINEI